MTIVARQPVPLDPREAFAAAGPMLATLGNLPHDPEHWAFEFKWDGVRIFFHWTGKKLTLLSRNGLDVTHKYPEIHDLGPALGDQLVILDGEVVALDDTDRPSFPRLQKRMQIASAQEALRMSAQIPVNIVLFDVLATKRRWVVNQPWTERRAALEDLVVRGPSWELSPASIGEGEAMLETARWHGLEGIVAKRLDSRYEVGRRSSQWIKIKLVRRQEFVVGGWTDEKGTRHGLGALLVGYFECCDKPGKLRYAGGVGSGFSFDVASDVLHRLRALESKTNPFDGPPPRKGMHFVRPELVVEVEFRRWPEDGQLQQASFKGVRTDKPAREVVREDVERQMG